MSASGRCRETGAPIFIFYFGRNIDYPVLLLLLAVRTVWLNIFVYMFHVGIFLREKYVWQLSSEKKNSVNYEAMFDECVIEYQSEGQVNWNIYPW